MMLEMSNDVQNPGAVILRINVFMTSIFAVASILSAVLFRQPWKGIAVVVSLVCFSVGVVFFCGDTGTQCSEVALTILESAKCISCSTASHRVG